MVDEDRFSYPFDATWYAVAQSFFALQHLAMLPLFLGLLILERRHRSRALRVGDLGGTGRAGAADGDGGWSRSRPRNAAIDDSTGTLVGSLYSLPMVLLGSVRSWPGSAPCGSACSTVRPGGCCSRSGVYVFVVMFPAVFGPMVAGRIAIGVWLLGYAWLGLELTRKGRL